MRLTIRICIMCRIPHLISSHSHTYLANFWSLSDSFSSNSDSSSHSLSSSAFTISSSGWGTLPGSGGAPTKLCRTSHWCVLHHYHNYYYLVLSKQKQNWAVSSQWVWLFDTFFGFGAVGEGGWSLLELPVQQNVLVAALLEIKSMRFAAARLLRLS